MTELRSFMNDEVSLKRWRLYLLRFGLLVFVWTALNLGVLALITEYSTRAFVWPTFAVGILIAAITSMAIYGVEAKSRRAKIWIGVVLVTLAILAVADRIRNY